MSSSTTPKRGIHWAYWVALLTLAVLVGCGILYAIASHYIEEEKKAVAQLGCRSVAINTEAYIHHEANTKHELPNTLDDLVKPPFGAPSFLQNGHLDLLDPWGKHYQMERAKKSNGDEYIIVKTTAPDGTPITQFGIGQNSATPE